MRVLPKLSPGCHFFGHAIDKDIEDLEKIIQDELATTPTNPGVFAIFAEIPSNPLLRTPDLDRLRAIADKYNIPIVLDGTVDSFASLDVRGYADILVTSLSKLFSGAMNVMGGR